MTWCCVTCIIVQDLQRSGEQISADRMAQLDGAVRSALDFSAQWNTCQLTIAGCSRIVKAWRATLMVRCQ